MVSLADLRREYSKDALDIKNVAAEPVAQFEKWLADAIKSAVPEPNAMNLATVSPKGLPSSRIVLLKGIENGCFIFYTNHQSQKGGQLEENPACALTFFWPELERQVRIEGISERVSEESATDYFQSRPRESQVGAWASPQSSVIADREILEARMKAREKKFAGRPFLPKPKQWGGYKVTPYWIEFCQGRPSRLHDRILYTRMSKEWKIVRLAP